MSAVEPVDVRVPARRRAAGVALYLLQDSPLWLPDGGQSLWGRIVTDPREVEAIRARIELYGRRRWFR